MKRIFQLLCRFGLGFLIGLTTIAAMIVTGMLFIGIYRVSYGPLIAVVTGCFTSGLLYLFTLWAYRGDYGRKGIKMTTNSTVSIINKPLGQRALKSKKKYRLYGKKNKKGLRRIQALRDIPRYKVKQGDLGGWVFNEDNLAQEGDAWIFGSAQVYDDARVYGNAQVFGNAWIYDNARVRGDVQVYDDAQIYGNAQVSGNARVHGDARVRGDAQVYDDAQIYGNAQVSGDALVYGDAWVYEDVRVSGHCIVCNRVAKRECKS